MLNQDRYKRIRGSCLSDHSYRETRRQLKVGDGVYPDLVLHGGQSDTAYDRQRLAVEIKICPHIDKNRFWKDLFKAHSYVEVLDFQQSLVIVANNDIDSVRSMIKSYEEGGFFRSTKGIVHVLVLPSAQSNVVAIKVNDDLTQEQ